MTDGVIDLSEDEELRRIVEIHDLQEDRRRASRSERNIWIGAARKMFEPGDREPCWICGKFISIVQAHHVIPVAQQYDRGFRVPDSEHVWLCPNHHAIAHLFTLDRTYTRQRDGVLADLSDNEFEKVMQLMRRSGRGPRE